MCFFVAFIVGGSYFWLYALKENNKGDSLVAVSRTKLIMDDIETSIKSEIRFNRRFPCDLSKLPISMSAADMHAFLVSTQFPSYFRDYVSGGRQMLPDAWHNELHFRIENRQQTAR